MVFKIQLSHITKRFGAVTANSDISINIEAGEIHVLAGENGAGKSTLMNVLYGLYQPDEGEILIDGETVKFASPRDSIKCRIGMVHQHFMLIPKLTVAENIIAGQETGNAFFVDRKKAEKKIEELSSQYGLKIDPRAKVSALSVTEQQRVEILKVLYREAEILIFDEPTAVLTPQEIDEFCDILLGLKKQGKTIIFISHKLAEVMRVSDHITVIRLGKVIGTVKTSETDPEKLTHMMVGRNVDLTGGYRKPFTDPSELLTVSDLSYTINQTVKKLDNVRFTLHEGEILGVAGVDGNGQEELVKVLTGQIRPDTGKICMGGRDITDTGILERKNLGLGFVPEDRHKEGLVLDYTIAENMILGRHAQEKFTKHKYLLDQGSIRENAEMLREAFDIRCSGIDAKASTLSGGNQQKIIIARETDRDPDMIIAVQPTRGLDVGAIEFVQNSLMKQRNKGKGVLLFSLELDEIFALSDRIAVMYRGQIVAIVNSNEVTREQLGLLMLGSGRSGGNK